MYEKLLCFRQNLDGLHDTILTSFGKRSRNGKSYPAVCTRVLPGTGSECIRSSAEMRKSMSNQGTENRKEKKEYCFNKLPENIRQIGEQPEHNRIYIEDYVITYIQVFRS